MAIPELYRYGREGRWFGIGRFCFYLFQGLFQSAVIYFFVCYSWYTETTETNGFDVGQYTMSTVMIIAAVMTASLFTMFNTHSWNQWVLWGGLLGPILIWVYSAIYAIIPPKSFTTSSYGNE